MIIVFHVCQSKMSDSYTVYNYSQIILKFRLCQTESTFLLIWVILRNNRLSITFEVSCNSFQIIHLKTIGMDYEVCHRY